jgi:hypothetical protein
MSDDDPIRDLLAGLPVDESIPTNKGFVAIPAEQVETATGNVDAVEQWITAHGGRKESDPLANPPPLRAGRGFKDQYRRYYLVPQEALER